MDAGVGFVGAFAAGLLSFLSPCVLPLVPGYLSFVTGFNLSELEQRRAPLATVLIPSLMFVAGFSTVFVALGASASILGAVLQEHREALTRIAGILVFVMGLLMVGVIKAPWLYGEARFEMGKARSFGRWASLAMGMAFAFGWTPCVGPILASILALAGSSADLSRGAALLATYSFGLGLPFVLTALLFGRLRGALRWLSSHSMTLNRVAGVLLMIVGAMIFTDTLRILSAWLFRVAPFLQFG